MGRKGKGNARTDKASVEYLVDCTELKKALKNLSFLWDSKMPR